jgi:prepilin-type N-terminal cleavage/methylation domain-containing protein
MHTPNPKARHAFTLIELLIVVAIIAILAAIAVPNFLEAQVRSKVSRVKSDLRTMRTAVESYAVDWNTVPRMSFGPAFGKNDTWGNPPEAIFGTLTPEITTPVAYITSLFKDPFAVAGDSEDAQLYTYHCYPTNAALALIPPIPVPNMPGYIYRTEPADLPIFLEAFGQYMLWSIGPAGGDQTGTGFWTQYDPTNGSVSLGHIFVSQKYQDVMVLDPAIQNVLEN